MNPWSVFLISFTPLGYFISIYCISYYLLLSIFHCHKVGTIHCFKNCHFSFRGYLFSPDKICVSVEKCLHVLKFFINAYVLFSIMICVNFYCHSQVFKLQSFLFYVTFRYFLVSSITRIISLWLFRMGLQSLYSRMQHNLLLAFLLKIDSNNLYLRNIADSDQEKAKK